MAYDFASLHVGFPMYCPERGLPVVSWSPGLVPQNPRPFRGKSGSQGSISLSCKQHGSTKNIWWLGHPSLKTCFLDFCWIILPVIGWKNPNKMVKSAWPTDDAEISRSHDPSSPSIVRYPWMAMKRMEMTKVDTAICNQHLCWQQTGVNKIFRSSSECSDATANSRRGSHPFWNTRIELASMKQQWATVRVHCCWKFSPHRELLHGARFELIKDSSAVLGATVTVVAEIDSTIRKHMKSSTCCI